jgi:protein TonB
MRASAELPLVVFLATFGLASLRTEAQEKKTAATPPAANAAPATNLWKKFVQEPGGTYPSPSYPKAAMRKKLQGTATVSIVVGTNGLPTEVKILKSSGQAILDDAAVDCVKNKWRWPAGQTRRLLWDCCYKLE